MRISDWSSDVCSSDLQEPFEQEAEQLKRRILEGECRPVEQLQQPVAMVKLHQRRDTRMVEPAIGLGAQVAKLVLAQRIADERGHQIGRASCRERVCKYG